MKYPEINYSKTLDNFRRCASLDDYNDWWRLLRFIRQNGFGVEVAHAVSATSTKYSRYDTEKQFRAQRGKALSNPDAFFVSLCHRHGVEVVYMKDDAAPSAYQATPVAPMADTSTPAGADKYQFDRTEVVELLRGTSTLKAYIVDLFTKYCAVMRHRCRWTASGAEAFAAHIRKTCDKYGLGAQAEFGVSCDVFWFIDYDRHIRAKKLMNYNPDGHRNKQRPPKTRNGINCFFGEHLLRANASAPVVIVESEKTAIIGAMFLPDFVWLATGGKGNLSRLSARQCLSGRKVFLCPDKDAVADGSWHAIALAKGWFDGERLVQGFDGDKADIADFIVESLETEMLRELTESERTISDFQNRNPAVTELIDRWNLVLSD